MAETIPTLDPWEYSQAEPQTIPTTPWDTQESMEDTDCPRPVLANSIGWIPSENLSRADKRCLADIRQAYRSRQTAWRPDFFPENLRHILLSTDSESSHAAWAAYDLLELHGASLTDFEQLGVTNWNRHLAPALEFYTGLRCADEQRYPDFGTFLQGYYNDAVCYEKYSVSGW